MKHRFSVVVRRGLSALFLMMICCVTPSSALAQDVAPLLRTHWGQGAPYNALCPVVDGRQSLAGCGPVAMAQVMCGTAHGATSTHDGVAYEWSLMPDRLTPTTPADRRQAVAALLRDCGETAFTCYGADRSSTGLTQMLNAMKKLFGYSPYMLIVKRVDYPGVEGARRWREMLYGELRAGRPVIMRGDKSTDVGGHIFVADGLRDTLVHANMGWNGRGDGWFPADSIGGYTDNVWMMVHVADTAVMPAMTRVSVAAPGTLRACMADSLWREVMRLRVEGVLNAADIAWLRQLCTPKAAGGADGRLAVVDLHDARMEYLPDSAFFGASRLVDMRLPEGLKVIGLRAFKNCMQLNRVDIPSSVWKIRWEAFRRCRNLLDIHFPEGVRNVLSSTFAECENLTGVRLPESVDTLGESVFRNCARLEKLYIPARTTHIGPFLTRGCPNVEVQLSAQNDHYRMADGRMEHRDAKGKWVPVDTPMPTPKGPRRDVVMPGPGSKVVKRYKMVNGKKVFLGVVGNDGRLKR